MDDVLHTIREQQEMLRRLTAEPLHALWESEAAIARLREQLIPNDVFRSVREEEQRIRRLFEEPSRSVCDSETAMARLRDQLAPRIDTGAFAKATAALEVDSFSGNLSKLADLTKAEAVGLASRASIAEIAGLPNPRHEIRDALEHLTASFTSASDQFRPISAYIDATKFTAATMEWDRVGGLLSIAGQQRDALVRVTDKLSVRHADLIASLTHPDMRPASLRPFDAELPTLGVFAHTSAVRSITPHAPFDDEEERTALSLLDRVAGETEIFVEEALYELKPAFVEQYRGARMRSVDRGPDSWTQGGSSLRKLFKGVVHTAAPNHLVLPWAKQNNMPLDDKGRPTRATKIEWLCRSIPRGAYSAFVRAELQAALALIRVLDESQHVDELADFEKQYDLILLSAEVALRHILTIWKTLRNH